MDFEEWLKQGREYCQNLSELSTHNLARVRWLGYDLAREAHNEENRRERA